jgi:hypothetical protein
VYRARKELFLLCSGPRQQLKLSGRELKDLSITNRDIETEAHYRTRQTYRCTKKEERNKEKKTEETKSQHRHRPAFLSKTTLKRRTKDFTHEPIQQNLPLYDCFHHTHYHHRHPSSSYSLQVPVFQTRS